MSCAASGLVACSSELDATSPEHLDESSQGEPASDAAPSSAPGELTPERNEQIWASLFGGFARASQLELSAEEQAAIATSLALQGIDPEDVSFVGANVFVQDVGFSAEPWLAQPVQKGKVLAQIVSQIIGTHDTSLVSPSEVIGASIQYASQPSDDTFLFRRPEVDPAFAHVLVLPDEVPEAIFAAFRSSVAEIGDASTEDCLSPTFLTVLSRSEFDAQFAAGPFDVPPRVIEGVYAPDVCGPNSLGCTQYPRAENVVLSPPSPEGRLGTFQNRVLFGGFIGINSIHITPDSAEFSTITHELMHALGIAHPVPEVFRSGAVAAKLVVPGTVPADDGFASIMAFRTSPERAFSLSDDDRDTLATLYGSGSGCEYASEPLPISAN